MRVRTLIAGAVALVVLPPVAWSGAPDQQLAAACAACHRPNGHDAALPPIAGLGERHVVELMLAYRSGERRSQIMHVVATALTPEEIASVAHYLTGNPVVAGQ